MFNTAVYYIEANLFCFLIFFIMLSRDRAGTDRREAQIKLDNALMAFMLYFLTDSFWAAIKYGLLPKTHYLFLLANVLNYIVLAGITYLWLRYVMALEKVPYRNKTSNKYFVALPFFVSSIILIMVYSFMPHLIVSEELELTLFYNLFYMIVPDIYVVAVLVFAVLKARKETNPIEKRRHIYIGILPFMVMIGGLIQVLFAPDMPIFCFCCTLLILVFYIQAMQVQISVDPLTGLNNRAHMVHYISQESNKHKENKRTFVMMMDVNRFKSINDTYGHAEGDRALTIVADALNEAAKSLTVPHFIARISGDEFIMILHAGDEKDTEDLTAEIREKIKLGCINKETPYILSVGIGCEELGREDDSFRKCMERADRRMYEDKDRVKREEAADQKR